MTASEPDDGSDERDEDIEDASVEAGTGSNRSPVDESAADELRKKRQALRRRYKIQDVIQRRQVLLVQVVKEERGSKGAALTTYLSLAGRYCVLMPNTSHGGGISRKISNGADRKRLKSIMSDLKLPSTMGLIVRTAGLSRTKTEIKRDFDYLARLWDEVRERTLTSSAPALIYRDSDLIKRAIRDLYHREIDEVVVEGEDGFKAARGFMKLLMPSHVRRVKQHTDVTPLFQRSGVEDQLNAMYQPVVQLKSGGYLVINPTEALVSIDINSGRSTREHNIEQTAFATNLEAAAEIARQLRLRDMAGLVVIDFIDMEQSSHVRKVEKAMKEALRNDRARIQVGRISSFGLMEMSRQRLRTGVLEASTKACPHCEGTGLMRTASSAGLSALRMIEDEAARGRGDKILLRAGREAAVYLLNKKRVELGEIEQRYGVSVEVLIDESLEGARMNVESSGPRPVAPERPEIRSASGRRDEEDEIEIDLEARRRGGRRRDRPRTASAEREDEGERPGASAPAETPWRSRTRAARGGRNGASRARRPTRDAQPSEEPRRTARGRGGDREPAPKRRRGGRKPARRSRGRRSSPKARRWSSARSPRNRRSPRSRPQPEAKPKARRRPKARAKQERRSRGSCAPEPAPNRCPPAATAEDSETKPAKAGRGLESPRLRKPRRKSRSPRRPSRCSAACGEQRFDRDRPGRARAAAGGRGPSASPAPAGIFIGGSAAKVVSGGMTSPLTRLARLFMVALVLGLAAPGDGPVDPARQRDRAAVPRHVEAADRGGRASTPRAPRSSCSTIPRSTPSSPPARPSISNPGCSPRPTMSTSFRASSRTSLATSPAATRSACRRSRKAERDHHCDAGAWRARDRGGRARGRHGHR